MENIYTQQVFDKHWFKRHQRKLLWLINSKIGEWIFATKKMGHHLMNPVIRITPNSLTELVSFDGERSVVREHFHVKNEYARRLYFYLYPLWMAMHIWDFIVDPLVPRLSFGFATLTSNPDASSGSTTVDGNCSRAGVSETFATIRSGAGNASNVSLASPLIRVRTNTTSNRYDEFRRVLATFDTSSLTSGASISDVKVGAFGVAAANSFTQTPDIDVVASTPASNNNLVDADYSQLGTTPFASIAVGSFSTVAYNDFTLDANGIANVSKTGISKFGFRISFDTDNAEPTWGSEKEAVFQFNSGDSASNKLRLVVTYTLVSTAKFFELIGQS